MWVSICLLSFLLSLPLVVRGDEKLKIKVLQKAEKCDHQAFPGAKLKFLYTGRLEDGTIFAFKQDDKEPYEFTLGQGQVIKGIEKGVFGMCLNEVRSLVVHPDLAYKGKSHENIPPHSTLHFEMKLIEIDSDEMSSSISHKTFQIIDANNDAYLSQDEVSSYIREQERRENNMASEEEHNKMIADVFNIEDSDKDGSISREEFFRADRDEL